MAKLNHLVPLEGFCPICKRDFARQGLCRCARELPGSKVEDAPILPNAEIDTTVVTHEFSVVYLAPRIGAQPLAEYNPADYPSEAGKVMYLAQAGVDVVTINHTVYATDMVAAYKAALMHVTDAKWFKLPPEAWFIKVELKTLPALPANPFMG